MKTYQLKKINKRFEESFKIKLSTALIAGGIITLLFTTPAITGSSVSNLDKFTGDGARLLLLVLGLIAGYSFKKIFE